MAVPVLAPVGSPAGGAPTVGGFALYDGLPGDPQFHFVLRDAALDLLVLATMILVAVGAGGARVARPPGALVPP